jgi:hypothetical protein
LRGWHCDACPTLRSPPVDASAYGIAPLPAERPAATRECLASLGVLGTSARALRRNVRCRDSSDKVGDALALYRGGAGFVHPAFFLNRANQALKSNVCLGPWIIPAASFVT